MKMFLEEETEIGNEKTISIVKEVSSKAEAIKDKPIGKKCYLQYCYHDEQIAQPGNQCKPCKREAI